MAYVPIVVPPHVPSHQTRELADLLGRVITEYEKAHPSVSTGEVREAAKIAVQVTRQGGVFEPAVAAVVAGVAVLLVGVGVYAASTGAIDLSGAGPFPMIAVLAFVVLLLPIVAIFRRKL